jgi:hypothetical protein
MTEPDILKILVKHHPLKRVDIYQLIVSNCEITGKSVPTLNEMKITLQRMLDQDLVYIINAPDAKDLSEFPLHLNPAYFDLASRRVK